MIWLAGGFGRNFGCSFSTGLLWHLGWSNAGVGSQNTGKHPDVCFLKENFPENEQLEPKKPPRNQSIKRKVESSEPGFLGFILVFRGAFSRSPVDQNKFRMIHGARTPDPTKGQSLVKDFLNICLFGKMDWFDFDSGCQEAKRSDPSYLVGFSQLTQLTHPNIIRRLRKLKIN